MPPAMTEAVCYSCLPILHSATEQREIFRNQTSAVTIKFCSLTIVGITSVIFPPIDMHVCMPTSQSFSLCFWTWELKYTTDNSTPFVLPAEVSTSRHRLVHDHENSKDCSPWCKRVRNFYGTIIAMKNLSRPLQIAGKGMVFILFCLRVCK